jgi:hypothetical protein
MSVMSCANGGAASFLMERSCIASGAQEVNPFVSEGD